MKQAPKTFHKFRLMVAEALNKTNAPMEMIMDAENMAYEGGETFMAIWRTWLGWEQEIPKILPTDSDEQVNQLFEECIVDTLHDQFLELYMDNFNTHSPSAVLFSKLLCESLFGHEINWPLYY